MSQLDDLRAAGDAARTRVDEARRALAETRDAVGGGRARRPAEAQEHLATLRPDWRIAVLPDVGHVPQMETPDRYVAVVQRWLADGRVDTGAGGSVAWGDWVAGAGASAGRADVVGQMA